MQTYTEESIYKLTNKNDSIMEKSTMSVPKTLLVKRRTIKGQSMNVPYNRQLVSCNMYMRKNGQEERKPLSTSEIFKQFFKMLILLDSW